MARMVRDNNAKGEMMTGYTFEFQHGETCEGHFVDDYDAQAWVETILEHRNIDINNLHWGDWDADGHNDDGKRCWRMLVWSSEKDAENDAGAKSIGQLCKVGDKS